MSSSLANNELGGPLALLGLLKRLVNIERYLNYIFLINPETIGSLGYLNLRKNFFLQKVMWWIVLTCIGGPEKNLLLSKAKMKTL